MGTCKYCGNPAGFLRRKHAECEQKNLSGWNQMIANAKESALGAKDLDTLESSLTKTATSSFVPSARLREAIITGWEQAVEKSLEDDILHVDEEKQLIRYMDRFQLKQDDLDAHGAYSRVVKAGVIRDLLDGKLPQRVRTDVPLSFNFQKGETLVWAFPSVKYYEDRTRRQYVGGYQGVSIRVAKGVYYRTGGFRGTPVEHTERIHVDTGILAVTNKHVYFGGARKRFRVAFKRIISFEPFSDAIGIMRDAATAKPQIFVTGDGWFTYNLLSNLANL